MLQISKICRHISKKHKMIVQTNPGTKYHWNAEWRQELSCLELLDKIPKNKMETVLQFNTKNVHTVIILVSSVVQIYKPRTYMPICICETSCLHF